jgi:hypothetical protein
MSAYIAALKAEQAAAEHDRAERERAEAKAARARLTPLEDRLARVLAGIPVDVQREGLSLTALQASLRGRWRGNCHPGELGAALRKLGCRRVRRWRGATGFKALWYPTRDLSE